MNYPQEHAGRGGWSRWIAPVRTGYYLACCDCGLVHKFQFRAVQGQIQFRVQRDNRRTAQIRRHMK